jgi:hypothetical protein
MLNWSWLMMQLLDTYMTTIKINAYIYVTKTPSPSENLPYLVEYDQNGIRFFCCCLTLLQVSKKREQVGEQKETEGNYFFLFYLRRM